MNISISNYIASEFDSLGNASPIVYGMSDPAFRAGIDDGKIRKIPAWPTLVEGVDIANGLGARYVFTFDPISLKKGSWTSTASLYYDGRKIWSAPQNLKIHENMSDGGRKQVGDDISQAGRSMARTWVLQISQGPFRGIPTRKKITTPVEASGQEPKPVEPVVTPKIDDDGQLKLQVDRLIHQADYPRAIVVLRDAVDEKPFDVDRRILLVQALLDSNDSSAAGEEADRAVLLSPNRAELRALAARAWLAAGKTDEARSALNEAIARDPNGVKTRLMLAELSLARFEPEKARDHLDEAIKDHPTRQAYYLRGLSNALLGDLAGVNVDVAAYSKRSDSETLVELQRHYVLTAAAIDDSLKTMGDETRQLMSRAMVRPDEASVHDKIADSLRLLQARVAFLSGFTAPDPFKGSHDRRILANQLFIQTMLSMQSYCSGGGADAMTDARLDLGEALKEASGARTSFAEEQKPSASGGL
jgi:tetratricopeptide (TPR) repeat protein